MSAVGRGLLVVTALLWVPVSVRAQGPPPTATTAAPPSAAATGAAASAARPSDAQAEATPVPQGFTYSPEGRRDPFVSLQARGSDPARGSSPGARPAGLAGLAASEITLRGTIQGRQELVAIVQGADTRNYVVRPGEKLLDGVIRAIAPDSIVILQEVSDPLSREKYREVRKALRQMEEAK